MRQRAVPVAGYASPLSSRGPLLAIDLKGQPDFWKTKIRALVASPLGQKWSESGLVSCVVSDHL